MRNKWAKNKNSIRDAQGRINNSTVIDKVRSERQKTMQNWKKQFLNNASLIFEPAKAVSEFKDQIDDLKNQNDELAKALGKAKVERDWAVGKLGSLDISNKSLVDSKLKTLSKARQCELLQVSRSGVYYQNKP